MCYKLRKHEDSIGELTNKLQLVKDIYCQVLLDPTFSAKLQVSNYQVGPELRQTSNDEVESPHINY